MEPDCAITQWKQNCRGIVALRNAAPALIAAARTLANPPTCATCIHYREQRDDEPPSTITCMKFGSPVGNAAKHFGCILHARTTTEV